MKIFTVFFYVVSFIAIIAEAFQYFTVGLGLEYVFMIPLIFVSGLLSAFLPALIRLPVIATALQGLATWFILMAIGIGMVYAYVYIRDQPETILRASFYMESGLDIEFRANGTYKAINNGMGGASAHYGSYAQSGAYFITDNRLYLGRSRLRDTLIRDSNQLHFRLGQPFRGINAGIMWISAEE